MPHSDLPAPFCNIVNANELPFAQLAHQIRTLAVAAYGAEVDYQASAAWQALCAALESHRRMTRSYTVAVRDGSRLRERMSTALGLDQEGDDGLVRHEHDPDELVAQAEGLRETADDYREEAEAAEQERADEAWRGDVDQD